MDFRTKTLVCKDHDFESCDENNYSSEEHELSDDEGIMISRNYGIGRRGGEDNDDDYYWTDTASESEDGRNVRGDQNVKNYVRNDKGGIRNDKGDDRSDKDEVLTIELTHSEENEKIDNENRVTDEDEDSGNTEGQDIQSFSRHRPSGHRGHSGGHRNHSKGRGGHGRHSGGKGGRGHHSGGSHEHHHGLRLSKVFMPTGRVVRISVPDELKGWKCGRPTKLINLDPKGKNGKHEYKLVKKICELTKRQHVSGQFDHYRFVKIQKIVNGCFWKRYRRRQEEIHDEARFVNERMLFHGTNKVKELLDNGFDERYASIRQPNNMNATSTTQHQLQTEGTDFVQTEAGMFGAGLYFAKHSSKSNQYAFGLNNPCPAHKDRNCDRCDRHILLCRVTMGKIKKETGATKIAHAPPGHHSVEGVATPGGLQYPEYIVYRGEQVYAEYLITYKIVK